MAVCPNLRWLACVLVAAAAAQAAAAAAQAESPPLWLDRDAALAQARKQGKLLFVVHVSSDFTQDAAASREARLYRTTALADPRVAKLLAERLTPTLRGVGETGTLRLAKKDKAADQDFAIAYVCLPDERVLHFIPGFVSSDELLAELTWAERCYADLTKLPAGEQPLAARRAHLAAVAKSDLPEFARRFPSRWDAEELLAGESTVELPDAAAAARATFDSMLAARLGPQWHREASAGGLAPLAAHGGVAGELAHFILSEFPLAALGDLASPAYAACSGHRLFTNPKRRADLAAWWALSRKAGKPTLLVIGDDDYFAASSYFAMVPRFRSGPGGLLRSPPTTAQRSRPLPRATFVEPPTPPPGASADAPPFQWPPKDATGLPGLSKLAVQVVTLDELSLLLSDAALPPVSYVRGQPLRFLVHDAARISDRGAFGKRGHDRPAHRGAARCGSIGGCEEHYWSNEKCQSITAVGLSVCPSLCAC